VAAAAGHMWLSLSLPGVHGLPPEGQQPFVVRRDDELVGQNLGHPVARQGLPFVPAVLQTDGLLIAYRCTSAQLFIKVCHSILRIRALT